MQLREESPTRSLANLDDLVETALAAIVWVGYLGTLSSRRIKTSQQLDLLSGFWRRRQTQECLEVVGIHGTDEIELFEIAALEMPSTMSNRIATPFRGRTRARIGQLSHVVGCRPGTVDHEFFLERGIANQLREYRFRSG
jgi:hypothetical protein